MLSVLCFPSHLDLHHVPGVPTHENYGGNIINYKGGGRETKQEGISVEYQHPACAKHEGIWEEEGLLLNC